MYVSGPNTTHNKDTNILCMHACMYVCMHACMQLMYVYACMYVCMYVCMHACNSCMYVYMHVCMYACVYACMHACMHAWRRMEYNTARTPRDGGSFVAPRAPLPLAPAVCARVREFACVQGAVCACSGAGCILQDAIRGLHAKEVHACPVPIPLICT